MTIRARLGWPVLAAAALAACDSPSERSEPPAALAAPSGTGQSGTIGLMLRDTLVVLVTDDDGDPVRNVSVSWHATEGSGAVIALAGATDEAGRARAVWRLGARPGTQTVTVTAGALPPFSFTAQAGTANLVLSRTGGDAQRDTMGQTLPGLLEVTLRTGTGEPVPGIPIVWHNNGFGAPTPVTQVTDDQGRARASWTLASVPGTARATASVPNVQPSLHQVFTATSLVGATPVRLAPWSGSDPAPLGYPRETVTVNAVATLDNGILVPGLDVTWRVFSGGGSVVSSTPTDERGVSTAVWRLGDGTVADSIEATLPGGARAVFSARLRNVFNISISYERQLEDRILVRSVIDPFPTTVFGRVGSVTFPMTSNGEGRQPLWVGFFDPRGFTPGTYWLVVTADNGRVDADSIQIQLP